MPELANSVPPGLGEEGGSPPSPPVPAAASIPEGTLDYITPPPKRVIAVTVRYSQVRKGMPMSYDLAAADEEP